ncbi:protein phosphatase [Auraticoccus monumenti]|uniref:Protein phosphatase n=1 Tax=Auraticoccus monumenti TaxID=675864 RepID=A0A1G6VME0_9ACTN|nr:protein phosphatase [Auraticoccus monumenti]
MVLEPPVFAVADGMGDDGDGAGASAVVVDHLQRLARLPVIGPDEVVQALRSAHEDVLALQQRIGRPAASTVAGAVGLVLEGQSYWMIFNVGDSRVYRVTGVEQRRMQQVSVDHTHAQELVDAGRISRLESLVHPDRTVLTRAVGMRQGEFDPDFWLLPMVLGERLVVCSDGLVRDGAEVEAALVAKSRRPARQTADELVDAALRVGGGDDVSVVVVDVLAEPVEDQTTIPDPQLRR